MLDSFPNMVTNVIVYDGIIYLLENSGKVFNHTDDEMLLDLSSKVGVLKNFLNQVCLVLRFILLMSIL